MIFSCVYSPAAVNISPAACIFRHTSPSWTALDAAWSRGGSGGKTSPRLDPDWLNGSAHTIPFWNDLAKASWRPVARDSRLHRGAHLDRWGLSVNSRAAFGREEEKRGRPLLTGLLRSNQHRRPDHLGHTFQRGEAHKGTKKDRKLSQRASGYHQKMSIIWCRITRRRKGGGEGSDPAVLPRLMRGCVHSVTDKADRCDSPISRSWSALASSPPRRSYSLLNIRCGKVSSFRWRALRILDFGLVCSVSRRLCQQSVPGQSQEEPRRKESQAARERERERETGGGGSHRDPLEEEPRGFCRPACAGPRAHSREAAWRSTKEVVGARAGGSDSRG